MNTKYLPFNRQWVASLSLAGLMLAAGLVGTGSNLSSAVQAEVAASSSQLSHTGSSVEEVGLQAKAGGSKHSSWSVVQGGLSGGVVL